jgi:uncharacterized protein YndB with AHSA1/START domain
MEVVLVPSASGSVHVARDPAAVFAFVADGTTAPHWRSGVLDVAHESGAGVGARYRQGVRGPGGRRIAADYEVTAYEPGRRLAFRAVAGPVRPVGEYRFEPADGGTTVRLELSADLGPVKRLLMGRAVQASMDSEVAALQVLKRVLEATA